jgi:predicted PurR-regulated permease PerM
MKSEVRRRSAWIAFGVLLVASVLLASWIFLPLWKPLFLAAVLAAATHGIYQRLARRLGCRFRLAATLMTIAVVVLLLVPFAVIGTVIVREAIQAFEFVQSALREGGIEELAARLPDRIEGPARRILSRIPVARGTLSEQAAGTGVQVARAVRDVVASIAHLVFNAAMMLIAYFALLTEGKRLLGWIEDVSPLRGRQTIELLAEFRTVSRSVLRSTVLTAAAQASVASVGYLIAGVPNVAFFGFLTFFAAFVPSIGTAVVALPLAIILLLVGDTWQGIFLAAWALGVVGLVDNLLKPLLMRGGMHLHGVVIFFSLLGGILVLGAIGLLVGPLAVTFLLTMIRFGYRDFSPRRAASEPEDEPTPAKDEHIAVETGHPSPA